MPDTPIRILLVDDHTLFRSGIRMLLSRQPELAVVGEAADGAEGVKLAKQLMPDVVLLDLHMPGISGVEALGLLLQDNPTLAVVMLTVSEDADDLTAALKAGARGYLLKNIDADFLKQSIIKAAAGESVMSEAMTAKLMAHFRAGAPAPSQQQQELEKLTPREREILGFLAQGQSNKEIARTLDLAESTVKIHVQNILKKLGLSSRVQAAVYAVEHGVARRSE
ncbi:nitrate/nitrite response regulator NarL [Pseudogulbenkiania sp. NH8B]|uniref:Two component transcriptional regulator, LuxR family n=2 Tax=Pseudogulbenkiania TaxID=568394 RepID=A0A1Y6BXW6_9NEIS|nr:MULTISPECIES: response regulator [Pseudogulbenkiania]EEG09963.1 two component transcriptional regulator, LuxR family [Pseudogulbenkiania ferrooxidans 2002]BAK76266.1 nitrate/nitrite response regulator NarL [Pseudogulbenkiania sp. NH8B]SMF26764.1 two component transcriptional regulator, LuxR family [Pseudogulbenkiania subflava DSM 22618]